MHKNSPTHIQLGTWSVYTQIPWNHTSDTHIVSLVYRGSWWKELPDTVSVTLIGCPIKWSPPNLQEWEHMVKTAQWETNTQYCYSKGGLTIHETRPSTGGLSRDFRQYLLFMRHCCDVCVNIFVNYQLARYICQEYICIIYIIVTI